ncbi:hypothetical protein [Iodobacter sp. BJB302]|uniref:hypothetical protein n=1 Tax=Iodobacter sp. BJB302 TaxID=1506510 RepID=UPI000C0D8D5B|nr:hypothetical protein [Iodobacter sp. BJB302]PHU99799.1 hypothetical protein CSQ88_20565 [Iodobacter sp. BJB302]
MSSKSASLTSGLVAKKGLAAPAIATPQHEEKLQPATYYKALTVKLDRDRYEALKRAGVKFDKKSQEIFVDALDAWLKVNEFI